MQAQILSDTIWILSDTCNDVADTSRTFQTAALPLRRARLRAQGRSCCRKVHLARRLLLQNGIWGQAVIDCCRGVLFLGQVRLISQGAMQETADTGRILSLDQMILA